MIRAEIICVGKLKESYLREGCAEYLKRLGAFCEIRVTELAESRLPERPSEKEIAAALEQEAGGILEKVNAAPAFCAALCIEGKSMHSEQLAALLEETVLRTSSRFYFIIGSSYGLSPRVKQRADLRLSMSEMTFPHQLARLMLLEQLYRAFSILGNAKYHK